MAIAASFWLFPPLVAQTAKSGAPAQEQSAFGFDDPVQLQRPVKLPRAALDVLSEETRVASCLKINRLSPKELPADWFVASEVHLDGPDETDLVVLPGGRLPNTAPGEISQNACLVGANTAQMWVLRNVRNHFILVLSQIALGLEILQTRTNGLRDIQVGAVVGIDYDDSIDYKFDGQTYKIAARKSHMVGIEAPRSLSGYQTREFTQSPNESSEPIRAQARAWLWSQWKAQKFSSLSLKTHDSTGDEAISYYVTRDSDQKWQIVIETHRVLRPTASEGRISEEDLLAADEVERVEPKDVDSFAPRAIPDNENVPESQYRLEFLDDTQRIVGRL